MIFIGVMTILAFGLWQGRQANRASPGYVASRNLVIAGGIALPLLVAIFLVGGSLKLGAALHANPPPDAIRIEVTGWRWWWEIRYLDAQDRVIAVTANEMHVPVDRPVALTLESGDVIHSFWVPQLQGKTDLVPGTVNTSWFEADEAGTYRGQCAEFCGVQHALMAFVVIAESQAEFSAWLQNQRQPAAAPLTNDRQAGLDVFMQHGCASCHTIRGTEAVGILGPDLTHLSSRKTLGAATRPNTIGHLGGWIIDPQSIKPGNLMPATSLEAEELNALTAYLQSLE